MRRLLANAHPRVVRAYRRARNGHAKSRINRLVVVADRSELPKRLDPRCVYVLGASTPKWALFDCPCGRGHTIELNLASPARTRWQVTTNKAGKPSAHPSSTTADIPAATTGFGTAASIGSPTERPAANSQRQESNMHMVPVVSDNVAFVGYNHDTRTLRVEFRSGGTYDYFHVPVFLHEAMLLPHPWRRVGQQIRGHRYMRVAA